MEDDAREREACAARSRDEICLQTCAQSTVRDDGSIGRTGYIGAPTARCVVTDNLGQRASRSVLWNLLGQGCQQMIQFVVVVILARLLRPEDFGVFGLAAIFTIFLQSLRQWGYQAFLIQKKDIDSNYLDTAFWAIWGMGFGIFIVCFLSAPLVGRLFNNYGVTDVLRVLAITSLLSPFGAVQWALATRELNYKSLAVRNVLAALIYGAAVVALAYKGFGVWALVIGSLVREAAWSILFWIVYDWRPHFRYDPEKLKEMTRFSFGCVGSGTLNYAINNLDAAIVGKVLGPADLGQYNLAMNLISQPQNKLVGQIASVAFPVFSLMQGEPERMRGYYYNTLKIILVVVTPFLAILCASAHDFIVTIYGPKWEPAVIPVQIMCAYGLIKTMASMPEPVFLSKGRAGALFKLNVFRLALFVPSVLWGVNYGIVGVSWAILGCSVFSSIPLFLWAHRLLKMTNRGFYIAILKYAVAFLLVYSLIFLIREPLKIAPAAGLAISALIGGTAYCLYIALTGKDDAMALWTLLRKAI